MADTSYSGIPRPYGENLERKDDLSYVLGDAVTPGSEGGSVEEVSVKTGGSLADLWITKKISSFNWKPKKVGFLLDGQTGYAEFTDVYISGAITAVSGSIGGWSVSSNAIYYDGATAVLSAGMAPGDYPFYAGQTYANRSSAPFRVTTAGIVYATGAVIDGTSTVGGRTASTLASAINAAGAFINANLDTSAKTILGSFTFSGSGAIAMNTDANNGLWLSPTGILGKKAGVTTFAIDTGGNATFAGALSAATGTFAGTLSAVGGTFGTITSGTITGVTITGGTVGTASSGARIQLSGGSNEFQIYDSSSIKRVVGAIDGFDFYNASSSLIGFLYASSSTMVIAADPATSTNNLYLGAGASGTIEGHLGSSGSTQRIAMGSSYVNIGNVALTTSITISLANPTNVYGHLSITDNAFLRLMSMTGATASGLSGIQNGCMYYRSDVNDIRAYINGAWRTLSNTA